jgi:murein DD-endopeptidase MepM/ murein hydrolase activator NlpD
VLGFISANRRVLALSGIALLGTLTALPAAASALIPDPPVASAAQTLKVPSYVQPDLVARDAFGITSYAVVQWPLAAGTPVSSDYGYRSCSGCTTVHSGVDFVPGAGAPISAVADGVVTKAGYAYDFGNYVEIQHNLDGEIVSTLYAHMSEGSMTVSVGQMVPRGTVLGAVGETGLATGPHLHFAVIIGGEFDYVDPYSWLLAHVNV